MEQLVRRDRETSTILVERVLRYARRLFGDDAAEAILDLADLGDRRLAVTAPGEWCSLAEMTSVASAAATVCGDPEIGRRIGEEHYLEQLGDGTVEFLQETGSMETVLALTLDVANKMSSLIGYQLLEVGTNHAEFDVVSLVDEVVGPQYRYSCGIIAGYFARLPSMFGSAGAIGETFCRHRGDDRCRFRLVWSERMDESSSPAYRSGALERFEQLQTMAAEMAAPDDIDVVLQVVVEGACTTVIAHQAMLVVDLPGDRHPRVHHVGVPADEVEVFSGEILDGTIGERVEVVCVPVASARHAFGTLAVALAPGNVPMGYERRLMSAYARHAAGALDAAVALESARREQATAEALLALAHTLTDTIDDDEIARRLVGATATVTAADQVAIWIRDAASSTLRCRASMPEGATLPHDMAGCHDLAALTAATSSTLTDGRHAIAVPIAAHGRHLGVLAAAYDDRSTIAHEAATTERLQGLADQGAAALSNARLIAEIRHQALHDPLTGLPTRRLMEDRARQALTRASGSGSGVGLLFVDLDHFKEVNDSLGHAVGDGLLSAVAERFTGCLRTYDTVSRHGGDEFLVLLTNLPTEQHAEAIARKILAEVRRPFEVAGHVLHVSASVGVAWDAEGGATYEDLCHVADVAMYEAKDRGRNTISRRDLVPTAEPAPHRRLGEGTVEHAQM